MALSTRTWIIVAVLVVAIIAAAVGGWLWTRMRRDKVYEAVYEGLKEEKGNIPCKSDSQLQQAAGCISGKLVEKYGSDTVSEWTQTELPESAELDVLEMGMECFKQYCDVSSGGSS